MKQTRRMRRTVNFVVDLGSGLAPAGVVRATETLIEACRDLFPPWNTGKLEVSCGALVG